MEVYFTTLISSSTKPVCTFVPGFVAGKCACVRSQPQTIFLSSGRRRRDNQESDTFTKLLQPLTHPSPFLPSLPLGYPIALLTMSIILPLQTAILLNAAFVGFFILGQQVSSGDDDSPPMNLLALFAAVGSAGLLSPAGLEPTGNQLASATIVATVLALAGASLFVDDDEPIHDDEDEDSSLDWSAIQEWDDKLRQEEQGDENKK